MNEDLKTKFPSYVFFGETSFDTTPEKDDESGIIQIPTVCLDGDFTIDDLELILAELRKR